MILSRKKRPEIIIVADFMRVGDEVVKIDPLKTGLPNRCKLAMLEMTTGQSYVMEKSGS